MTPKEKALQLVSHYSMIIHYDSLTGVNLKNTDETSKKCALISVDEIIELEVVWYDVKLTKDYPELYKNHQTLEFWEQVKIEIENL